MDGNNGINCRKSKGIQKPQLYHRIQWTACIKYSLFPFHHWLLLPHWLQLPSHLETFLIHNFHDTILPTSWVTPFLPLSLYRSTCFLLPCIYSLPPIYHLPSHFNFHLFVDDSKIFIFYLKMSIHRSHMDCSINNIGIADDPVEKENTDSTFTPYTKFKSRWIK